MVGAAAAVASVWRACLCALGVDVHRDAWGERGGRTEGGGWGGVCRFDVLCRCGRVSKRICCPTVWRVGGGSRSFSRRGVERLIGQSIQVKAACRLVPTAWIVVRR